MPKKSNLAGLKFWTTLDTGYFVQYITLLSLHNTHAMILRVQICQHPRFCKEIGSLTSLLCHHLFSNIGTAGLWKCHSKRLSRSQDHTKNVVYLIKGQSWWQCSPLHVTCTLKSSRPQCQYTVKCTLLANKWVQSMNTHNLKLHGGPYIMLAIRTDHTHSCPQQISTVCHQIGRQQEAQLFLWAI